MGGLVPVPGMGAVRLFPIWAAVEDRHGQKDAAQLPHRPTKSTMPPEYAAQKIPGSSCSLYRKMR
jgi:hypothetical protein